MAQDHTPRYTKAGEGYERDMTYVPDRITAQPGASRDPRGHDKKPAEITAPTWPVEPGRYRLVAAKACPWANRSIIVRNLLGLEDVISLGMPGPTHDARSWTFDLDPGGVDPVLGIERLQEAYFLRFPGYERGITVPTIVDVPSGEIVTSFALTEPEHGSDIAGGLSTTATRTCGRTSTEPSPSRRKSGTASTAAASSATALPRSTPP